MDQNTDSTPSDEVWVQDLTDRNLFRNRKTGLKLRESALESRASNVIKVTYEAQRSSALPYGYFWDSNGSIAIDTLSADVIRQIFKLFTDGLSLDKIAKKLEGATPLRGQSIWRASDIREILSYRQTYESGLLKSDSSLQLPKIL